MIGTSSDFIYNGLNDWHKVVLPTGEVEEFPGVRLYDWGHSEAWGLGLQTMVWASRYSGFKFFGLDIEQEASVKKGGLPVEAFIAGLRRKFRLDGAEIYLADSHSHAALVLATVSHDVGGRPQRVFNFDAHHDLGYGAKVLDEREKDRCDCASWAWHSLDVGVCNDYIQVYPDWLGYRELGDTDAEVDDAVMKMPWMLEIREEYDLQFTTWGEFSMAEWPSRIGVSDIILARSSSWTPPWADLEFEKLVWRLEQETNGGEPRCLDCYPFQWKVGPFNACEPRKWDRREAEEYHTNVTEAQILLKKFGEETSS